MPRATPEGATRGVSYIPKEHVNFLLVWFSNTNKIFVFSLITFHVYDELLICLSELPQWDLHVIIRNVQRVALCFKFALCTSLRSQRKDREETVRKMEFVVFSRLNLKKATRTVDWMALRSFLREREKK